VKLACGFFFSWNWQRAGQAAGSSHSIELTDADAHPELLLEQALHGGTGNTGIGLTVLNQTGEHLASQLDWMPMPPVGKAAFFFASHSLEQSVDGRPMHWDDAANQRLMG
jgi:hypothetical protein